MLWLSLWYHRIHKRMIYVRHIFLEGIQIEFNWLHTNIWPTSGPGWELWRASWILGVDDGDGNVHPEWWGYEGLRRMVQICENWVCTTLRYDFPIETAIEIRDFPATFDEPQVKWDGSTEVECKQNHLRNLPGFLLMLCFLFPSIEYTNFGTDLKYCWYCSNLFYALCGLLIISI